MLLWLLNLCVDKIRMECNNALSYVFVWLHQLAFPNEGLNALETSWDRKMDSSSSIHLFFIDWKYSNVCLRFPDWYSSFSPALSANKRLSLTLESFTQQPTSSFFKLHAKWCQVGALLLDRFLQIKQMYTTPPFKCCHHSYKYFRNGCYVTFQIVGLFKIIAFCKKSEYQTQLFSFQMTL